MQAALTSKPEKSKSHAAPEPKVEPGLTTEAVPGAPAGAPLFLRRLGQAKLKVNEPGDIWEREADRVAEQVMRMPEPMVQRKCAACAAGGSTCPNCEAEEEEARIQRKPDGGAHTGEVASDFASRLGTGAPLDSKSRAFFEPRFGRDFLDVRVHADQQAETAARSVNARAFTLGRNVVFAAGEYEPRTDRGRSLLAHELTHVVQQSSGGSRAQIARKPGPPAASPGFSVDQVHETMLRVLIAATKKNNEQTRKEVDDVFRSITKGQAINTIHRLNAYSDAFSRYFWVSVPEDVQKGTIDILTTLGGPDGPLPVAPPKRASAPAPTEQPAAKQGAQPPAQAADKGADEGIAIALRDAIAQAIPQERFAFIFTELDMRDMKPMLDTLDRLTAEEIGTLIENLHTPHTEHRFVDRLRAALATVQIAKGSGTDIAAVTTGVEAIAQPKQTEAIVAYVKAHATHDSAKTLFGLLVPKPEEAAQGAGGTAHSGVLEAFKQAVRTKALAILAGNLTALDEEEAKYADTSEDSPAWTKLRAIVKPMLARDRQLKQAAKDFEDQAEMAQEAVSRVGAMTKRREEEEEGEGGAEGARPDSPVDHAKSAVEEQRQFATSRKDAQTEAPAEREGEVSVSEALQDLQAYVALWKQRAESARKGSQALHAAYPILAAGDLLHDEGKEGASGAGAKGPDTNEELFQKIRVQMIGASREAIARTKERILNDSVPLDQFGPIVREVQQEMHLDDPAHAQDKAIVDGWIEQTRNRETYIQIAIAGATIALGIAAILTGGAAAVVLGLMGSTVGLGGASYNLYRAGKLSDAATAGDIGAPLLDDSDEAKAAYNMALVDLVLSGIDFAVALKKATTLAKLRLAQTKGAEGVARAAEGGTKPAEIKSAVKGAEGMGARQLEKKAADQGAATIAKTAETSGTQLKAEAGAVEGALSQAGDQRQPLRLRRGTVQPWRKSRTGDVHDLGHGTYYTLDRKVARQYAVERRVGYLKEITPPGASKLPSSPPGIVLESALNPEGLKIFDFYNDPVLRAEWEAYLRKFGPHGERIISGRGTAKNYNSFFETWMKSKKLEPGDFDVIIGPEYRNAGSQLCVRDAGLVEKLDEEAEIIEIATDAPSRAATP
jgi:hypothetical protein